jgi:hypothetical protein
MAVAHAIVAEMGGWHLEVHPRKKERPHLKNKLEQNGQGTWLK